MEQRVIDTLHKVFELNDFIGVETRAVEAGVSLLRKGEISKEIYLLSHLQEVGHESGTSIEERLDPYFDLAAPLSRYVIEHSNTLAFPFKRWQIRKVWCGEHPQESRFREFVQTDIDVIGTGDLPGHYEVGLLLVMVSALEELCAYGLPKAIVYANNRKLSEGFYRGLGLTDVEGVLREIDKLDEIGADEVTRLLAEACGVTKAQARTCLRLAELITSDGAELVAGLDALCEAHGIVKDPEAYMLARQRPDTLVMIIDEAAAIRPGSVIADLKIARDLDYHTGSICETFLDGTASLGSVCSGGRYDNLTSQDNRKYPGVGLSIGLSRPISYMLHTTGVRTDRVSPAAVLVAVWNEEGRPAADHTVSQLRARSIAADVALTAAKLGKQIEYMDRLDIPYVWFPVTAAEDTEGAKPASDKVKNIAAGERVTADYTSWEPDTVVAQQTVEI